MPRRSSRSSLASRTSLSEPTGSASLAIAMTGNLTAGVWRPSRTRRRSREAGPASRRRRGLRDARLVERAGIEAEGGGGLVVAAEVGVEHRGVVGRDASSGRRRPRGGAADARRARRRPPCGGSRAGRRRGRCPGRRARATRPGSSSARKPWRRRSAPRLSSAPWTDAAPATSPACGTEPRPSDFASVKTSARTAPAGTPPRGRRARRRRRRGRGSGRHHSTVSRASSSVNPRVMSGVRRISTPCSSFASCAPLQTPSKTSSHEQPWRTRSAGLKIPSR